MRHILLAIAILLPFAGFAARDPSGHGPYAVGSRGGPTPSPRRPPANLARSTPTSGIQPSPAPAPPTARSSATPRWLDDDRRWCCSRTGRAAFRASRPFLTEALASWGFVVAAPPHPGNTTFELATCDADAADSFANRVADIR